MPCFYDEEIHDIDLESQKDTITDVVSPHDGLDGNTVDELTEDNAAVAQEINHAKSLARSPYGRNSVVQLAMMPDSMS